MLLLEPATNCMLYQKPLYTLSENLIKTNFKIMIFGFIHKYGFKNKTNYLERERINDSLQ